MNRTIHICFLRYIRPPKINSYRFADHFVDTWTTAVGHEDKVQAVIEPKRSASLSFLALCLVPVSPTSINPGISIRNAVLPSTSHFPETCQAVGVLGILRYWTGKLKSSKRGTTSGRMCIIGKYLGRGLARVGAGNHAVIIKWSAVL